MRPFFDTTRPESSTPKFRKVEFLDLPQGQTIIRIISAPEEVMKYSVHYVKGMYIKCLEDTCPVCASNRKLIAENPEKFRDIAGYSPKSDRFTVNVIDKTPAKICTGCGAEIKGGIGSFPPICPKCEIPIVAIQPQPLNKVKVLSKGRTLAEQLNAIDASIQDETGTPIGINNYDIGLFVQGAGRSQTITVIPLPKAPNEPADLTNITKFDLSTTVLALTPDEITDLQKGISVRDILTARNVSSGDKELEDVSKEATKEVVDAVSKLMGN